MSLITHKIVFTRKFNECSTTAMGPYKPLADFTEDLESVGSFIVSNDNWMHVQEKNFDVREVNLPSWLDPQYWIENYVAFKYLWAFGWPKDGPEAETRFLLRLEGANRLACIKLLQTQNFRSEFRKSLRDQLVAFIAEAPENRKHPSPFSNRQWECLLDKYTCKEARQIADRTYYSNV